jgi:hypothetical protein
MSIKILVLKSGEDVIADVQEMISPEEKVIGYYLTKPCVVKLRNAGPMTDDELDPKQPDSQTELAVTMYPWMPLAKEKSIPVPSDWVVTMFNPVDKINDMFKEDILDNGNESDKVDNTDDSGDFNISN